MPRRSSTAAATPAAAPSSSPRAVGSVTSSRADSTWSRRPARAAPTPSWRSRRNRRRSSSRAETMAARLCCSRSASRRAAIVGATWSQTISSSSRSRESRRGLARPRSDPQHGHDLAAVAEVECLARAVRGPGLGDRRRVSVASALRVDQREAGRAHPERRHHAVADVRRHVGEVESLPQPGREPGQHLGRARTGRRSRGVRRRGAGVPRADAPGRRSPRRTRWHRPPDGTAGMPRSTRRG